MHWVVAIICLVSTPTTAETGEDSASDLNPKAACKTCHADIAGVRATGADVHSDLECEDCHLDSRVNPHVRPSLGQEQSEAAASLAPYAGRLLATYVACVDCHEDEVNAVKASSHWPASTPPAAERSEPTCQGCHGSIHTVHASTQTKTAIADRCMHCHSFEMEGARDPAQDRAIPKSSFVVETYRETIHGKMLRLGNDEAASCADCHTGHSVFAIDDERSTVSPKNRSATCMNCHPDATDSFAMAISHQPPRLDHNFWAGLTSLLFSILTVGVILFLFLHVLLDFMRTGRNAMTGANHHVSKGAADPAAAVDAGHEEERFDIHLRVQHWIMIASFIVLVATGWPLKSAAVGMSSSWVNLLGGQAVFAIIHRIAGALLIADALYHLGYLFARFRHGTLQWGMVPGLRDAKELIGNIMYYLGLREERPKFGRWSYVEKFDYWAVFWGMVIMGGSGLLLWFPELAAHILPGESLELALIAHSDEALLAALAIFLWHFYNVHLRPTVFPMSWVWLTGRISAAAMYEEHRGQYEAKFGNAPPRGLSEHATWHHSHIWAYIAVLALVVGAAAVGANEFGAIRNEIISLSKGGEAVVPANEIVARAEASKPLARKLAPKPHNIDEERTFDACYRCHNEQRTHAGAAGFAHRQHFEENDVDDDCGTCHQIAWHESQTIDAGTCLECHEADEIEEIIELPAEAPPPPPANKASIGEQKLP